MVIIKNCQQADISGLSDSFLDCFVDSVIFYAQTLAKDAVRYADIAGRTEVNGFDVFDALWSYNEDVKSLVNFLTDEEKSVEVSVSSFPKPHEDMEHRKEMTLLPYRAAADVEFAEIYEDYLPPQNPQFFVPYNNQEVNEEFIDAGMKKIEEIANTKPEINNYFKCDSQRFNDMAKEILFGKPNQN